MIFGSKWIKEMSNVLNTLFQLFSKIELTSEICFLLKLSRVPPSDTKWTILNASKLNLLISFRWFHWLPDWAKWKKFRDLKNVKYMKKCEKFGQMNAKSYRSICFWEMMNQYEWILLYSSVFYMISQARNCTYVVSYSECLIWIMHYEAS